MNADLRQQILVSLRAEGVGEADKAREAIADLTQKIQNATRSVTAGTSTFEEYRKEVTSLGTSLNFWNGVLRESQKEIESVDVGLHKLQVTAIKFGDDLRGGFEKSLGSPAKIAKEVAEASDRINAALAEENAAFERHADVVVEADTEIERIQQRAAAATVTQSVNTEQVRASNAKAAMLQARESENFLDALKMESAHSKTAETATIQLTTAKKKGAEASDQFGYGILHISHAFQDLQYGMAAAINNIPLIVTAFGGGAGLAGGLMSAAVGVQILGNHMDTLKQQFSMAVGPASLIAITLDEIKKKIKEIEGQKHMIAIDYTTIDAAKLKLEEMEKHLAAFNSASGSMTSTQEKVAKAVKEVVIEESGATDQKAGTQNLVNIIRKIQEQSGAFWNEGAKSEELKKLQAEQDDIKRRTREGKVRPEEVPFLASRLTELDSAIPKVKKEVEDRQLAKIRDMIGSALSGEEEGRSSLEEAFNKNRAAFTTPDLARKITPVDPAFGPALAEAKGTAIHGREEEDAQTNRDLSAIDNNKFIRGNRKKREENRRKWVEFSERLDAIGEADDKKNEVEAKRAADAHQQEVNKVATTYGTPLSQAKGPGSMTDAIINRVGQGQSDAEISQGLGGQIGSRLDNNIDANIVNEVADKIIADATAKVRAQAEAAGGIDALGAGRQEKFDRAGIAAQKRTVREGNEGLEAGLAGEIWNGTGGQLGQQGTMAAAHRAMASMKQGHDVQSSMMEAVNHVMLQMVGMQEGMTNQVQQFNQKVMAIEQRLNGVQAQGRRGNAQRPGLLPQFQQ